MELKSLCKNAWHIVWHNPVLWLFGFFAILFAHNEINILVTNFDRINNWIDNLITFNVLKTQFDILFSGIRLQEFLTTTALYNISLGLIIFLLFLYLSITSQIALVISIGKLYTGKKQHTFIHVWEKTKTFFLSIFGLYLLALIITYGFLYLLSLPFLYTLPIPIITYIIIFLILVFLISFISRFAIFYIILKHNRLIKSIKNSFLFLFKNFSLIIKTSVTLFFILIAIGFGLLLAYIGTSIPFLALISLFLYVKFVFGFWIVLILWIFLLLTLSIIIGSIFSTFQTSVWTLLFFKRVSFNAREFL